MLSQSMVLDSASPIKAHKTTEGLATQDTGLARPPEVSDGTYGPCPDKGLVIFS